MGLEVKKLNKNKLLDKSQKRKYTLGRWLGKVVSSIINSITGCIAILGLDKPGGIL